MAMHADQPVCFQSSVFQTVPFTHRPTGSMQFEVEARLSKLVSHIINLANVSHTQTDGNMQFEVEARLSKLVSHIINLANVFHTQSDRQHAV